MSQEILNEARSKMENALSYLHEEYGKFQTGRANAALVDGLVIDVFGASMPIKGVANISIPEANQIAIQPYNRDHLSNIEKAVNEANLGLNPTNDGAAIRLILPPLTEERRRDLVKLVHKYAEDARVSVRNSRHDALRKLKDLGLSDDELAGFESKVQKMVDDFNQKIETDSKHKDNDIMTI